MKENYYIYLLLAFILGYFANSIIKQICGQNIEGVDGPSPAPAPAPGPSFCIPGATPAQMCPGNIACPDCGSPPCECPTAPEGSSVSAPEGSSVSAPEPAKCIPGATPAQMCPGNIACPDCGSPPCECPTAPTCSDYDCPYGKRNKQSASSTILLGDTVQDTQNCCEDIPPYGGGDASSPGYACGEPGGQCISCGGYGGWIGWGVKCGTITDAQRKRKTNEAALGPWAPASGLCGDQQCGAWCGAEGNRSWEGKKCISDYE